MGRKTLVKGRFIVACQDEEHRLLEDGVIVIDDDTIEYVGSRYEGRVDKTIDATDKLIIPGLINVHTHVMSPLTASYLEDLGSEVIPGSTTLYEHLPAIRKHMTDTDSLAGTRYALLELLKAGSTTSVVLHTSNTLETYEASMVTAELMHEWGLRGYVAPMHASGWYSMDGRTVRYSWDEEKGYRALEAAERFVKEAARRYGGLVRGMIGPRQTALCTPDLLRETRRVVDRVGGPIELHASESTEEYYTVMRRYGMTPIEYLADTGLLGSDVILGHCIYVKGHSLTRGSGRDLQLIREAGSSVAHCPWIFARRGTHLETFKRYRDHGINIALGTDTFPQDIVREMRWALVVGKIAEGYNNAVTILDVFNAATLGGARALGRPDLGRIQAGAKADLVMIGLDRPSMIPVRDPMRNLLYSATGHNVDTVMVNGRILVEGGVATFVDEAETARGLQQAAEAIWERFTDIDEVSPPILPPFQE